MIGKIIRITSLCAIGTGLTFAATPTHAADLGTAFTYQSKCSRLSIRSNTIVKHGCRVLPCRSRTAYIDGCLFQVRSKSERKETP